MTEREKVIKGLKCWTATLNSCDACPTECPYYGKCMEGINKVFYDMMNDALSLLKEQEPRVMTLHDWEANHVAKMPVWVEWSESARGECAECAFEDGWVILNIDGFADVLCFGGRCWTSRPTDEQREATPWEPPKEET